MASFRALLACFVVSLWSSGAQAGAANADFHCTSAPGAPKLALEGNIPGDFASFELRLSSETATETMTDADERISVIENFAKGVFTVAVTRADDRNLLLYALPTTIKLTRGPNREVRASFSAMLLQAPKPGHLGPQTYESTLRDVPLTCTYVHSI